MQTLVSFRRKTDRGIGRFLCVALAVTVLSLAPAVGVAAATDTDAQVSAAEAQMASSEALPMIPNVVPAMAPGAPPPEAAALADRQILSGFLLIVFAALAGITLVMWRDLGRRANGA